MSDGAGVVLTLIFMVCMMICCVIGAHNTGRQHGREEIQQEAVEQGFAEYNAKSGEWQWKKVATELVP